MCSLENKKPFVSCIKICGVPIIPPLITPNKRVQIQAYKEKAIEIEKRIQNQKLNLQKHALTRTIENILSFENCETQEDALSTNSKSDVPLSVQNKKSSHLTCNIFDVSEYNDNGVIIYDTSNRIEKLSPSTAPLSLTDLCIEDDYVLETQSIENIQPKPRLLRSNSYTLDTPSPILLEHLRKQAQLESNSLSSKQLKEKRRSLDDSAYKTFSSIENQSRSTLGGTSTDINSIPSIVITGNNSNKENGCDFEGLVKDLAKRHFGSTQEQGDVLPSKVALAEAELQEVLKGIPEIYANDILGLIQSQENQSQIKLKENVFDERITFDCLAYQHSEAGDNTDNFLNSSKNSSWAEESKSITIYSVTNSPNTTNNPLNTSTPLLIDFENDVFYDSPTYLNSTFNNHSSKIISCGKELFPHKSSKEQHKQKERWAAIVLTAAAKGFLIRRLKRTERVQNLVQTIREALVCALSLHKEQSDVIEAPDIELHRRLIQQISAACYEFYDIFFSLSTPERMAIIALDRQRIQEKLKRPKSVSSIKLDSSRSSTKSRQSINTRQKKPLIPSFAA